MANKKNLNHLTDLQKYVTLKNGTEKPFENDYWDNTKQGIYVDVIDGKVLFLSKDKFNSGTGWPSFTKTIKEDILHLKNDNSHNMLRVEARTKSSDIHLGHVFNDGPKESGGKRYCINSASLRFITKEDLVTAGYGEYLIFFNLNSIAYLAGGCFWGMEHLFAKLKGVIDVISGYTGGDVVDPTYQMITTSKTNHSESIKIIFDEDKINYEEILKFFFRVHNPTTLNKQGNDIGSQYRSVIFYVDDNQKEIATEIIKKASAVFPQKIVTSLEKLTKFYNAEEYHQDYLQKNPNGYNCHIIREELDF